MISKEMFVLKNYDIRVEKFEPPFKLTDECDFEFLSRNEGYVDIYKNGNKYNVYSLSGSIDEEFNTYQKAIDYAHKLFKGEE